MTVRGLPIFCTDLLQGNVQLCASRTLLTPVLLLFDVVLPWTAETPGTCLSLRVLHRHRPRSQSRRTRRLPILVSERHPHDRATNHLLIRSSPHIAASTRRSAV